MTLYYATPDGLPAFTRPVEAPLPEIDIPTLATQWTLWLPPGYEIPETSSRFPIDALPTPRLTQRLFGILGRSAGAEVFNPLIADDWQHLAPQSTDNRAETASGLLFVEALGKRMAEYLSGAAETELNWGQLLTLCAEDVAPGGLTVLVDDHSLDWLQLNPRQRVRFQPGDTPLARGAALLRHANLGLLVWHDAIALAATTSIAGDARQIAACDHNVVFSVIEGPLAGELHRAVRGDADSNYQLVSAWQAMPPRAVPPWSPTLPATADTRDAGGWRTYTMHASQSAAPQVRIIHTGAVRSLAWSVFLVIVAIGLWRRNRPPASLIVLGALAAALAVLLPIGYGTVAGAAFLGALVCLALRVVRVPARPAPDVERPSQSSSSSPRSAQPVALLLLAIALVCGGSATVVAQPPLAAPIPDATSEAPAAGDHPSRVKDSAVASREPAAPLYRVFVPVDDEQRLQGGKYYVPLDLYKQLLQQAGAASGAPKDWLVTRVMYRGALARDPVTRQLRLTQLKASFDVNVLSTQAHVLVPFPHNVAGDAVVGARLDGRAIPITWNAAGDALDLGLLGGERYQLELDLQARLRIYGASAGFDVSIPPVAQAEVELTVPPDAPTVEVPTARGQVVTRKVQQRVEAHLGAVDRLSVRWPAGIGMETATANIEAEELVWVKVRPGTTVFDVRFKYRVLEGGMRQVRLLADPRLQLLPSTSTSSPIAAVHVIPGDPQRIDLELTAARFRIRRPSICRFY